MIKYQRCRSLCGLLSFCWVLANVSATTVELGSAGTFNVLAGQTTTNTGGTVITGGNVGVFPGSAATGYGTASGGYVLHLGDSVAEQAQIDLNAAYITAAGLAPTMSLTGSDLGGLILTPGVYSFSSSAQLTGTLTLNALGDSDALFVFQIGSTLTTGSNSKVVSINTGSTDQFGNFTPLCDLFWQVGSSATLGTGSEFQGHILALTSITLNTGASILDGSALALNGSVTLDANRINNSICEATTASVPDCGATGLLLAVSMGGLMATKRRLRGR